MNVAASDSVYFKIFVCDSTGFTAEAIGTNPVTILGVADRSHAVALSLGNPTPNPVTGLATLEYQLPKDGRVSLSLVDIQGRSLRVLVSERQLAGSHRRQFATDGLGTGIVFAKLDFEGRHTLRRVVVLR